MSIRLTKAQRKVIALLQKGEVIVHDDRYFQVSDGFTQHRISWKVWQSLTQNHLQAWDRVDPLIYQEQRNFNWVLTQKGRDLKL
jgi:hypothetical protein